MSNLAHGQFGSGTERGAHVREPVLDEVVDRLGTLDIDLRLDTRLPLLGRRSLRPHRLPGRSHQPTDQRQQDERR